MFGSLADLRMIYETFFPRKLVDHHLKTVISHGIFRISLFVSDERWVLDKSSNQMINIIEGGIARSYKTSSVPEHLKWLLV